METDDGFYWTLTPEEFDATHAKVEKLNSRAIKKGWTGRLELVGERKEVKRDTAIGPVTEIIYRARIDGEAPSYNGWRLLAAVDFIETGFIVNTAPGVDLVDRSLIEQGKCDHCKHNRMRVKAYLVGNDAGEQLQVGSTCLKDFIGWHARPVWLSTDDVKEDVDGFIGGGHWPRTYTTETVLAAAWATIKLDGYVRSSEWERRPTRDVVGAILNPTPKEERELRARYGALQDECADVAKKTREFILSTAFAGDNEYVFNMKAALSAETVISKHFGFVVSAPQAWARYQEKTLIRERERSETLNEWFGGDPVARKEAKQKAERITVNVKVKSVRYIDSDFGSTTLYTLVADTGHVFKWFASSDVLGDQPTEEFKPLTGSIKAWEEYKGHKSTVLTRCKL
jgi:hypothetical protein